MSGLPNCTEAGQGDVAVLLLHGIGGGKAIWQHTLPALAAAGFRAVATDFPAYGGAPGMPTLDAMTQELFGQALPLAALIDWLRGRPWPGAPNIKRDDGFEQLGWRIGLAGFAGGLLQATRDSAPAVSVRAKLEKPA